MMSQSRRERPVTSRVHTVQNNAWGEARRQDGTRAKLENMSYGQTLASKEHCNIVGMGEARRRGLDGIGKGHTVGQGVEGKNERGW